MAFIAYKITHRDSGKAYIGITTQSLAGRWKDHCKATDTYISRTIRKYGSGCFDIEHIASTSTLDGLRELEILLIAQHGTLKPRGYNVHPGGEITKHTAATIERMRTVQSNRSPEWRANISKALSGTKFAPERVAKMKERSPSAEARQKIAETLTGRVKPIDAKIKTSATIKAWWAARKASVPEQQEKLL